MVTKILKKIKHKIFGTNNTNKQPFKDAKLSNTKVFGDVNVAPYSTIINSSLSGKIQIGSKSELFEATLQGSITTAQNCKLHRCEINGNVTIGRNTSLWGPNLDIYTNKNGVEIGSYCSIARNVSFQTYNHNSKKITSYFIGANFFNEDWENEQLSKGKIVVGNDVWIGTHCVILGGVTISNGAMIAANSVVSKDVPAFAIVAGSPAKVIGYRFEQNIIDALEKLKWWNWSDEILFKNKFLFENELSIESLNKVVNE